MENSRKIGPTRQLSLQCETPTIQLRRKSLKKQNSEDLVGDQNFFKKEQRSSSAKTRAKTYEKNKNFDRSKISDKPPSVKLAWSENVQKTIEDQLIQKDESLVAKKCQEIRRPATAKVQRQGSLDKDSILYSRQELAERLRHAWNEREKSRHNLNIVLTSTTSDSPQDEDVSREKLLFYF